MGKRENEKLSAFNITRKEHSLSLVCWAVIGTDAMFLFAKTAAVKASVILHSKWQTR